MKYVILSLDRVCYLRYGATHLKNVARKTVKCVRLSIAQRKRYCKIRERYVKICCGENFCVFALNTTIRKTSLFFTVQRVFYSATCLKNVVRKTAKCVRLSITQHKRYCKIRKRYVKICCGENFCVFALNMEITEKIQLFHNVLRRKYESTCS